MPPNEPDVKTVSEQLSKSKEIDENVINTRPKRKVKEIAKSRLKDHYANEIGTFLFDIRNVANSKNINISRLGIF